MTFAFRLALLLVFALAGGMLAVLSMASGLDSRLDEVYPLLVAANIALVVVMAGMSIAVVWRAWSRFRERAFGSRLTVRLATALALMGILPVALVSLVSVQFLARTIDSWFSQSVEGALRSGADLGRATVESFKRESLTNARRLALAIESVPDAELNGLIEFALEGRPQAEVIVLSTQAKVLAIRSSTLFRLVPDLPTSEALAQVRAARQFSIVEPIPGAEPWSLQTRALALSVRKELSQDPVRIVQWVEPVPARLAQRIEDLNRGLNDYQQLTLGKQGIRRIYGVSLALALLLAVFGALSVAVLLSGWLAGPLRALERATREVAGGDYPRLREDLVDHELNDLIRSFNQMTAQLQEAREVAAQSNAKRESSLQFLEQMLQTLSTGVLVFDRDLRLQQFNPSAERVLALPLQSRLKAPLQDWLDYEPLVDFMKGLAHAQHLRAQRQIECPIDTGGVRSLLVHVARLTDMEDPQAPAWVMVVDDIGELLAAQRAKTWSDMARRLAHEIKNPLTPIQLSAERLERRLGPSLTPEQQELLSKSAQTIVDQVAALKTMVDAFRNYARLPDAMPSRFCLSELVQEVMTLYASDPRVRIAALASRAEVLADRTQILQVVHNLVQNAQDAVDHQEDAIVEVSILKTDRQVILRVDDNGPGLDPEIAHRVFEPYVTSKAKGSGLGLAIVRKIAQENHAEVSLQTRRLAEGGVMGTRAEFVFALEPQVAENEAHGKHTDR
ncbi:MAG: Sensor protein kinase walK [Pseudomonadota bacterium]|jgi:nitrogen fixation/metabolism regulation signal transduction histidine kinase